MAKALLVSSCKESRASGAAIGAADISTGASDAIFGNRINMRSVDILASVNAKVSITKIICNDDDDVWFACSVGIIAKGNKDSSKKASREVVDHYSFFFFLGSSGVLAPLMFFEGMGALISLRQLVSLS